MRDRYSRQRDPPLPGAPDRNRSSFPAVLRTSPSLGSAGAAFADTAAAARPRAPTRIAAVMRMWISFIERGRPPYTNDVHRLEFHSRKSLCGARVLVLARFFLDAHQPAQLVASARQAGAHRADRHVEDRGDLVIRHAFEADEQNHLALLRRQFAEGGFQIAQ